MTNAVVAANRRRVPLPAINRLPGQDANDGGAAGSLAAVYASFPTQFNLLIAVVYANVAVGLTTVSGFTLPSGAEVACGSTAAHGSVSLHYKVAGAGESKTVSAIGAGASVMRMQTYEYSGVATTSLIDGVSSASSGASQVTSQAAAAGGQLATTNANDLLFAVWGLQTSSAGFSVGSSFNLLQNVPRLVSADRVVSSASTYNPVLTLTSTRAGGVIVAFKAA